MDEARKRASMGDIQSARKLAERASTFPVQWDPAELSPAQFVQSLAAPAGGQDPDNRSSFPR